MVKKKRPIGITNYKDEVSNIMKNLKKHLKKLAPLAVLALPLSSFAANPQPTPSGQSGQLTFGTIVRAVEQGVGNVIVYPMEQFARTIKYTFDTRAEKASVATQSRFLELAQLQLTVNQNSQDIAKQFESINTLMTANPLSAQAAMTQNNQYCTKSSGIFGKKTCFSASSANNFLNNAQYQTKEQAEAAQQFLHTAAGAYLSEKAPSKDWNKGNPSVISYEAFYKTTQAIQSLAEHNLSYAYAIRQADGNQPSELAEYNQVMTGDSSSPSFWKEINKIPVVGQLVTIANYMPALAVGISQENKYLSMINNSLSVMLIQQNMLAEKAFGGNLYQAADEGSQADNGQSSKNGDDSSGDDSSNSAPSNDNSSNSTSSPGEAAAQSANSIYKNVPKKHVSKSKAAAYALSHPGAVSKARHAEHSHPHYPGE